MEKDESLEYTPRKTLIYQLEKRWAIRYNYPILSQILSNTFFLLQKNAFIDGNRAILKTVFVNFKKLSKTELFGGAP